MSDFVLEQTAEGKGRMVLPQELTVATAAALQAALTDALAQYPALILDGRAVSAVDVAGLQLLCSAHRTAVSLGKEVQIEGLDQGPWPEMVDVAGMRRHEACSLSNDRLNCLWL